MKTLLKNLLLPLVRFKDATCLNVIGLTIAFASFCIILLITMATVTVQSWRAATANPVDSLKAQ